MIYIYLLDYRPSLSGPLLQRVHRELQFRMSFVAGMMPSRDVRLEVAPVQTHLVVCPLTIARHRGVPDGHIKATAVTTIPIVEMFHKICWR